MPPLSLIASTFSLALPLRVFVGYRQKEIDSNLAYITSSNLGPLRTLRRWIDSKLNAAWFSSCVRLSAGDVSKASSGMGSTAVLLQPLKSPTDVHVGEGE